jgi:hypothetical protein
MTTPAKSTDRVSGPICALRTLQGSISALPAPADDSLINVFARGSNGQLYQSYETGSGQFTG